ncbi:MAG: sugar kinase [Burkholderiaceae bacterium]
MFELSQQDDGRYLAGFGGDTSNCAISAARQGASVGYVTRVGDDPFGQQFLDLWHQENIDTSAVCVQANADTGVYFIAHGPDGHQFSYRRAGSAASQISRNDLPQRMISDARILHVSGISQAISETAADTVFEAIRMARDGGTLVSYDTNLRTQLWSLDRARAITHAAMSLCDIALPGLDDARLLTGMSAPDDIVDFYLHLGASLVALTLGSAGTLVATSKAREHVPAYDVSAIDATGAGDTFDGAFLAQYLRDPDPVAATRYANAAAALSTQHYGAVASMPKRETVLQFLGEPR